MNRKRGRWALGLLAAMAALVGLLWWDMHRRSLATIEAHEREVAQAISRARSRDAARPRVWENPSSDWDYYREIVEAVRAWTPPKAGWRIDPAGSPESFLAWASAWFLPHSTTLQEQFKLIESGRFYPYEERSDDYSWERLTLISSRFGMVGRESEDRVPARLVLVLAALQDFFGNGGYDRAAARLSRERDVIQAWWESLERDEFSCGDAARVARMADEVWAARPSLHATLEAQHAMDRLAVINVLRTRSDDRVFLKVKPGWRDAFSWKMLLARILNELDRGYRRLQEIEALPVHARAAAAEAWAKEIEKKGDLPTRAVLPQAARAFKEDAWIRMQWTLLRVATAIAWHQEENGTFPASLEDLVPRYIARIPVCPFTGQPLGYEQGKVWSVAGEGKDGGGRPVKVTIEGTGDVDRPVKVTIEGDGDEVWTVRAKPR